MKQKFSVTGMTCSACQAHVEKAVRHTEGVQDVQVNLLSNSMVVTYDQAAVSPETIIAAVQKAGYGAALPGQAEAKPQDAMADQLKEMKRRLIVSFEMCIRDRLILHHDGCGTASGRGGNVGRGDGLYADRRCTDAHAVGGDCGAGAGRRRHSGACKAQINDRQNQDKRLGEPPGLFAFAMDERSRREKACPRQRACRGAGEQAQWIRQRKRQETGAAAAQGPAAPAGKGRKKGQAGQRRGQEQMCIRDRL